MRPLTRLIPYADALRRVLDACRPIDDVEVVAVADAAERVLAEPLLASFDVPGFDRAAMDGYAVHAADTAGAEHQAARLQIVGAVHAGDDPASSLAPQACMQIATGAPVPSGADAVVMVERTLREGPHILIDRALRPGENISRRGSDLACGSAALAANVLLTPARIAVAAALGRHEVHVWRAVRVSVASTGSELKAAGARLRPGEIHDSNGPALTALCRRHLAQVSIDGPVPDDLDALRAHLRAAAARNDLLVLSGASSAGERDHLRDAIAAEGKIDFHGVAVKPGKPLLLGRVGGTPVLGLPGYPASCLSDAYLFVVPALHRLGRRPPDPSRRVIARISEGVKGVPDRLWFLPVRLDGVLAVPTYRESGSTTSLADAVGYVEVPPTMTQLEPGDPVEVHLF